MNQAAAIFLDFNLPNAASWFYFSLMLTVALFFKFNRFFSVRNWDLLSLFLLVPGFLFLLEANRLSGIAAGTLDEARRLKQYGYIWLMIGSVCLFIRCLIDLILVSRPALFPNLNLSGLAALSFALFAGMIPVAARLPIELQTPVGKRPAAMEAIDKASSQTVGQVQQLAGNGERDAALTRFWVARAIAILCHFAVITALVLIGSYHFQNTTSGMAAAAFYLLLPYTAYHIGQVHHVLPSALLVWAIFCYRRPWLSGVLLGLAAGSFFFPVLTLPVWISFYRKRGVGRFLTAFLLAVGLSLAITSIVLLADGQFARTLHTLWTTADWQPWMKSNLDSIWMGVHGAYRLPVFILYIAFVITTSFWPSPKNLGHLVALCAAVLIGIQFWYADQGGVYVLWYLPLVVLMIFRPNLTDRVPPQPPPLPNWPSRLGKRLADGAVRFLKSPDSVARV
jgi:hypothetical protein